jgi:hypothetical protein
VKESWSGFSGKRKSFFTLGWDSLLAIPYPLRILGFDQTGQAGGYPIPRLLTHHRHNHADAWNQSNSHCWRAGSHDFDIA